MAEIIVMPQMNLSMEDGLITEWYKQEGETVAEGELLFSVENEKEIADITSPTQGIIVKIIGVEGERYKVKKPIAIIAASGEDWSETEKQAEKMDHDQPEEQAVLKIEFDKPAAGMRILPKIRKLLREKGIDLEEIQAYFPGKKITENEIKLFESQKRQTIQHPDDKVQQMSSMRQTIADAMIASCTKTARLTNFMEVDMTFLINSLDKEKEKGKKISITAIIIAACAHALQEQPVIRSEMSEQTKEIIYRKAINIGCAVDVEGGLVVPVVRDADQKNIIQITEEIADYVKRSKEHRLEAHEREGGTFTVSSVGMFDVDFFTPIINYPQTAILGVGKIKVVPRYADDLYTSIVPRHIMEICLTYDHRVIDGVPASQFLQAVRKLLEDDILIRELII